MATKTRKRRKARSAKQRANDKRLGAMARSRNRGVATKVRAKRWKRRATKRAARAVIVSVAPKRRRGRRRGRRAGHRAKHRVKHVRRGRSRGRHRARRRTRRVILSNPALALKHGVSDYLSGFTKLGAHMQAATKNGWKGYAAAGAGAVGTVFLGTLLARFVMPFALKTAPSIAGTPMGARALSFGCYYTGGWALAKFTPGLSQKTRDAIMFGTLVAAVLEIVKPGLIATAVSKIPVIGETVAGHLDGIESELSDYVDAALQGMGFSDREYDGSRGFHGNNPGGGPELPRGNGGGGVLPGISLSDLAEYDMAGVSSYDMAGVGNYAMAGLGCAAADNGASGG